MDISGLYDAVMLSYFIDVVSVGVTKECSQLQDIKHRNRNLIIFMSDDNIHLRFQVNNTNNIHVNIKTAIMWISE